MSDANGRFVWYELMTTDVEGAREFYGAVVGWGAKDVPMPGSAGHGYTMLTMGETPQHGLMALPDEARAMGARPSWTGYVEVPDVDQGLLRAARLGGQAVTPAMDIPGVGRFAIVSDPTGGTLALFHSSNPDQDAPAPMNEPGRVCWSELHTQDWEKAFSFYGELMGWRKTDSMDMGPMGTYQMYGAGDTTLGGMFNSPAPHPFWLYYFVVGDIDQAQARVLAAGGRVDNEVHQVPGGGWIVQCTDPQGAAFALLGSRQD